MKSKQFSGALAARLSGSGRYSPARGAAVPRTRARFWPAHAEYAPKQIAPWAGNHVVPRQEVDGPQRLVVYKTAALPAELHRRQTLSIVADPLAEPRNPSLTCGLSIIELYPRYSWHGLKRLAWGSVA